MVPNLVLGMVLGMMLAQVGTEPGGLGLGDLPGYLEALQQGGSGPGEGVSFRTLWEAEGEYRGRVVEWEGRAERGFEAGAVGRFPAIVELWVLDDGGNPWCVVYPRGAEGGGLEGVLGRRVRFGGTFLRMVEYASGAGARRAPLVVGPGVPRIVGGGWAREGGLRGGGWGWDVMVGIGSGLFVALVLLALHVRRPDGAGNGAAGFTTGAVEFVDEPEDVAETGVEPFRDE